MPYLQLDVNNHYASAKMARVLADAKVNISAPTPLGRTRDPFFHPESIFEVKWDGFRSLAYVHQGDCRLISRNGNQFKSFPALAETLPAELGARSAVLDGEIVALDRYGTSRRCCRVLGSAVPPCPAPEPLRAPLLPPHHPENRWLQLRVSSLEFRNGKRINIFSRQPLTGRRTQ
jgi:hypothetical protein